MSFAFPVFNQLGLYIYININVAFGGMKSTKIKGVTQRGSYRTVVIIWLLIFNYGKKNKPKMTNPMGTKDKLKVDKTWKIWSQMHRGWTSANKQVGPNIKTRSKQGESYYNFV